MTITTVSGRFEVQLPRAMCSELGIGPGDSLQVIQHVGRIELVRVMSDAEARGYARGLDTATTRDPDRV